MNTQILAVMRAERGEKPIIEVIGEAWKAYQETEKYGLEFGKACYDCQQRVATRGGVGNKGKGIVPTLEQLSIPKSTAYWWIKRYKYSVGLEVPPPEPDDRLLDGSEYSDLTTISAIIDEAKPTRRPDTFPLTIDADRCYICNATPVNWFNPSICAACGKLVCDQCSPSHQAGHPQKLKLSWEKPKPTTDELVRQVEIALIKALDRWPRGNSVQKLREAIERVWNWRAAKPGRVQ